MFWRLLRPLLLTAVVLVLGAGSATVVLSRTQTGLGFLRDEVLARVRANISGDVQVADVTTSSSLLRGVTMHGIRVIDDEGGTVLTADSLRASYSLMSLLTRRFVSRMSVWSPVLTVQRMDGGDWNVIAAFSRPDSTLPSDQQATDTTGAPAREESVQFDTTVPGFRPAPGGGYELDRVEVIDGVVRVAREGGRRDERWTVYDGIGGRISNVRFGAEGSGDRADVDRLTVVAHLPDGDLDVRDFSGRVDRDGTVLEIEGTELGLPASQGSGSATLDWTGPDGIEIDLGVQVDVLTFDDLGWLGIPFPEGIVSGRLDARIEPGTETTWSLSQLSASAGNSRARGTVAFTTGRTFRFTDVAVTFDPLERAVVGTWLPSDFPIERLPERLRGTLDAEGPPEALQVGAVVVAEDAGTPATELDIRGRLVTGANPGADGLRVLSRTLAFSTLSRLAGLDTPLVGGGSLDLEIEGRADEGLSVAGHVSRIGDTGGSTVRVDGRFRRLEDRTWTALGSLGLRPLVLEHLDPLFPGAGLMGTAVGEVAFQGNLHSLRVTTDLQTSGGPLAVEGRVDIVHPANGVTVSGYLDGLDLAALSDRVPEPSVIRGDVSLDDLTTTGESIDGFARLSLLNTRIGALDITSLYATAEARDGILMFDSLRARSSVLDIEGSGALPLTERGADGEVRISVRTESLGGLRPFLLGDSVIVADTLTDLERDMLMFEGIDPDTLQSAEAVRMAGRASGELVIRGRVGDLTASGLVTLEEAAYNRLTVDRGTLNLAEFTYPGRRLRGTLTAGTTTVIGRTFARSDADVSWDAGRGTVSVALVQGPTEDVRLRGSFESTEGETTWFLDEFTVRLEGDRWNLGGPAIIRWGEAGYRLQNVRFVRPGLSGFRLVAEGTIPRSGDADLDVRIRRLDLERMARLFQFERGAIRGEVDADLVIRGTAARPTMTGSVALRDVGYASVDLSGFEGEIAYRDRRFSGNLNATRGSSRLLALSGAFPARVSFSEGFVFEVPDEPLDLSLDADSVPLGDVLGFFPGYDRSRGWLDGRITFAGTPSDLEPGGELRLVDGATSINAFGVRPEDVQGTFRLRRDGTLEVDASATEAGDTTAVVTGTITLNPVRDPLFDLTLNGSSFNAVGRRDVSGRVTGEIHLGGSYREPLIEGTVTADQGELFIDEFVRSASVVDIFDSTFVGASESSQEVTNPFLQGLRADVSVVLDRNSWLRSQRFNQSMNVELSGQVQLTYVRSAKTVAMIGDLSAVRGTYTTVGRSFDIQTGDVTFVGTPGVNPNLNFTASNRIRTPQGPLDVTAAVTGTLLTPTVRLTSDDQALSESDLYSYLIFAQPTAALSRDQQAFLQGATGFAVGTVVSQLGSVLAEDIPIDYLAISTTEFLDGARPGQGLRSEAAATGVEVGKYVFDDVFVGVKWRPFGPQGLANRDAFSGRIEWRFRDGWSLEAFAEDRFLRESFTGFEQLSFDLSKVYGLFMLRQWGY